MRAIYTAPTVQAAQAHFEEFAETWRDRNPAMIASWERSWGEFVPFLEFPAELRKVVYTTNAIESLNARFRRAAPHRGPFPTQQATLKAHVTLSRQRQPKRKHPRTKKA